MHFIKLKDNAVLPKRGTEYSAGYDLVSLDTKTLYRGERFAVSTGIAWQVDLEIELSFYVGIIKPRSGLAFNYGIDVLAGVIDADYKDEIKVILINHGDDPYHIKAGDRIAQLVVLPYYVINGEDGNAPIRSGGFGSTGN